MNSYQKVNPGSTMHGVVHNVVQMDFPEKIFYSISVHVDLVSYL